MKHKLLKISAFLTTLFYATGAFASALDRLIEKMSAQKTDAAVRDYLYFDGVTFWVLIASFVIAINLVKLSSDIAQQFQGAALGGNVGNFAQKLATKTAVGLGKSTGSLAVRAGKGIGKSFKSVGGAALAGMAAAGSRIFMGGKDSSPAPTNAPDTNSPIMPENTSNTQGENTPAPQGENTGPKYTWNQEGMDAAANKTITANGLLPEKSNASSEDPLPASNKVTPTAEDDINEIYGGTPNFMKEILQQAKKETAEAGTNELKKEAGAFSINQKALSENAGKTISVGGLKKGADAAGTVLKETSDALSISSQGLARNAGKIISVGGLKKGADAAGTALKETSDALSISSQGLARNAGKTISVGGTNDTGTKRNSPPETPGADRTAEKPEQKKPELPSHDKREQSAPNTDQIKNQLSNEINYKINAAATQIKNSITVSNEALNKSKKGG